MRILLIAFTILCLNACSFVGFPGVYRINVEQGNIVTQEMVDQLESGMSRRQVRFILGTPLMEDSFNQDRWDYVYLLSNSGEILVESTLTVHFDGDTMTHFTGTYANEAQAEATEEAAEVNAAETQATEAATEGES
jgi:outer membrane protein assembly factor BamE